MLTWEEARDCTLRSKDADAAASALLPMKDAVAKGGASNMLTGAERSKILWELNDRLAQFNKRLSQLSISIRYYTMADVWNRATAGMIDRNTAEIAGQALDRWHRCARIVTP